VTEAGATAVKMRKVLTVTTRTEHRKCLSDVTSVKTDHEPERMEAREQRCDEGAPKTRVSRNRRVGEDSYMNQGGNERIPKASSTISQ
jgi:hypothetical protein